MGNVQAASAPPPPSMPPPPPPSPTPEKSENTSYQPPTPLLPDLATGKNPGTMEDLHKQCKGKNGFVFISFLCSYLRLGGHWGKIIYLSFFLHL